MSEQVGSIHVDLDLNKAGFDRGLDEASSKTSGFGGALSRAEEGSKNFAKGLLGVGAGLFGIAVKSTFTAARTETLGVAMNAVAKATGTSTKVLKEQEETMKKQGITTQEARSTLTKFMQSQLDVAQASKIARVAQDLAVIAGENSSETTARLTDAIATMNPMLLRQVGIVKNSSQIFEEYGETIGKSGEELTDVEKKQAIVNAIMQEGQKVAGTYEAAMGTVGKKMTSLKRYFEEAANTIGAFFLPIFGKLIDGLGEFLKKITPENIKIWVIEIKKADEVVSALAGAIVGALTPAIIAMTANLWKMYAPLMPFIIVGAILGYIINEIVKSMGGWKAVSETLQPYLQYFINEILPKLWEWLTKAWEVIQTNVIPALQRFWDWLTRTWTVIVGVATAIWDFLYPILKYIGAVISTTLVPAFQLLWEVIKRDLWPALKGLWDVIAPFLVPILKILGVIIGTILVVAINIFAKVLSGIILIITVLISWFSKLIIWLTDIQKWFQKTFGIEKMVQSAADTIMRAFKTALNWLTDKLEKVKEAFNKALDLFRRGSPSTMELVQKSTEAVISEYGNMFDKISNMAGGFSPEIRQVFATEGAGIGGGITTTVQIYGGVNVRSDEDINLLANRINDLIVASYKPSRKGRG